jgi:hypothetical protein
MLNKDLGLYGHQSILVMESGLLNQTMVSILEDVTIVIKILKLKILHLYM